VREAAAAALALAAALGACGGEERGDDGRVPSDRDVRMGALGGGARTQTLARMRLRGRLPGERAWVAHEVRLAPGDPIRHAHEAAFVYARRGAHSLTVDAGAKILAPGEGAAVAAGTPHRHAARAPGSAFWEVRLAAPGSPPPPPAEKARRVFASRPLEGIPAAPAALFIEVVVPPRGGRTTVHTHPGPEFIYQLSGRIDYQNAIVGTKRLGPGGAEAIPPGTAVQKRNPFRRAATFLSLFLADPAKPFAPKASF
jgi:quercetin dioxygenase-like cupin family protein